MKSGKKEKEISREVFYAQMRKQSRQWELIDQRKIEEETNPKPYRPKNNGKKKNNIKSKDCI